MNGFAIRVANAAACPQMLREPVRAILLKAYKTSVNEKASRHQMLAGLVATIRFVLNIALVFPYLSRHRCQ